MGGRRDHTCCCPCNRPVVSHSRSHAASDATATVESRRGRSDPGDDPTAVVVDDGAPPMFSRGCISAPHENIRNRRDFRDDGRTTIGSDSSSIAGQRNELPNRKGGELLHNANSNGMGSICCGNCRTDPTRRRRRGLLRPQRESPSIPSIRRPIGAVVAITAVVAGLLGKADGQYRTGTALYEENMDIAEAELTASLKGGDYVEDVFYPDRQVRTISSTASIQTSAARTVRGGVLLCCCLAVITPAVSSRCTAYIHVDNVSGVRRTSTKNGDMI